MGDEQVNTVTLCLISKTKSEINVHSYGSGPAPGVTRWKCGYLRLF